MKKFLAFLLIAIVACTTVEDHILESFWDIVKQAWEWIQSSGVLDQLKQTLRNLGKEAAITLCSNWIERSICEFVINTFL